jgi:hypothetical protein
VTLTRRELLRLAAAAAASPLIPDAAAAAAAAPVAAAKAGRFFSAAEMVVLDELCEAILPADEHSGGARAAGVAVFIDDKLAQFDPGIPELQTVRDAWKAGLAPFLQGTPEARVQLLERLSAAEQGPKTDSERFFKQLKEWTTRGYYTSSLGIHDEMEYKGNTLLMEFEGTDPASLPRNPPEP